MDTSSTIIETDRLRLKAMTPEYVEDIFREFTPAITTYMMPKPAQTIDETVAFVEQSIKKNKEGSNLQVVILNKITGEFFGCAGVHHMNTKTPALGIWVKKSAHGHGYGKEAVIALKKWTDQHVSYDYIIYPVAQENQPSRRIPESLGGEVAREYEEVNMSGKQQHLLEYRIYPPKK